ncbi:MAG: terminase small subunit [Clostridia bacterium]|nr:terminase small subunit [Clostridia bacterium]
MALTPQKERFCLEYIQDYNQTKAAIRAGYKAKNAAKQGCKLMKDPEVRTRIEELQQETRKRLMINQDHIVLKLMKVADMCMAAVPVEAWNYVTHQMEPTGQYQIDAAGAVKALTKVGEHIGMFRKDDQPSADAGPVFLTGEEELKA